MDDRWAILVRVRDLRMQLAMNEVAHRHRIQARAEAALEEARQLQMRYEELAARAGAAASPHATDSGAVHFNAGEAQMLLSYAVCVRLKAQAVTGPIRRAEIICGHAQTAADQAREEYRRAADRREAVVSRLQGRLRAVLLRQNERQDEALVEDRSPHARAAIDGGR